MTAFSTKWVNKVVDELISRGWTQGEIDNLLYDYPEVIHSMRPSCSLDVSFAADYIELFYSNLNCDSRQQAHKN